MLVATVAPASPADSGGRPLGGDALGAQKSSAGAGGEEARWSPYKSRRARQRLLAESKGSGRRRHLSGNARKGAESKWSSGLVGQAVRGAAFGSKSVVKPKALFFGIFHFLPWVLRE